MTRFSALTPAALSAAIIITTVTAATLPSLLAYNLSPSPTFLNQALAFALWAAFAAVVTGRASPVRMWRDTAPLQTAMTLVAAAAIAVPGLPASLALSAIASLIAAAVLVAAGAAGRAAPPDGEQLFAAFCWAWVVTGILNVLLAIVQVFFPDLPDGEWLAQSGLPGRAVGNLRQPNHLSSLLLWGCIAVVGLLELGRLRRWLGALLLASMVFAVVLTASRTGVVSVLLLALWGLLDRRLSKPTRMLLLAAPLIYALSWWLMAQWAVASQHSFGGTARLAEGDISSSRFAIWRDTLGLIRMHPWAGVGFGEFNFAWTLTPFPHRPVAFFDHTHNLPLQLAVELGLPLAAVIMALMLWALWRGARNAWTATGTVSVAQRCAMLMVLMIGLHSLLEYPLWYSYFLLPAAWAWGFALQREAQPDTTTDSTASPAKRGKPWLAGAALLVVVGAVFSVVDYMRVAAIFVAEEGAPSLEKRIERGQRSVFFAHHADYAAVTSGVPVPDPAHAFDRATHYLLDTRLMSAWAKSLAAQGQVDAARHVAARLREFHKADAEEFFAPCALPAVTAVTAVTASMPADGARAGEAGLAASVLSAASGAASTAASTAAFAASAAGSAPSALDRPFQCQLPLRDPTWKEFLPKPH